MGHRDNESCDNLDDVGKMGEDREATIERLASARNKVRMTRLKMYLMD